MALFKNSIASSKTQKVILNQANILSSVFSVYEKSGDDYIFSLKNGDNLIVRQDRRDSLFSKIFRLECVLNVYEIDVFEDFECKLALSGMRGTMGKFKHIKGNPKIVEELNESDLIGAMNKMFPKVQIEFMTLKYSADERTLRISIVPYAGSVVWLLVPPISYHVKIWENELKAISDLISVMYNYFKKYQTKGQCA